MELCLFWWAVLAPLLRAVRQQLEGNATSLLHDSVEPPGNQSGDLVPGIQSGQRVQGNYRIGGNTTSLLHHTMAPLPQAGGFVPGIENGELVNEKYKLIQLAGQGRWGYVWEAQDTTDGKHVALKFFMNENKDRLLVQTDYNIVSKYYTGLRSESWACGMMTKLQNKAQDQDEDFQVGPHRFLRCFGDYIHIQNSMYQYPYLFVVLEYGGEELYKYMQSKPLNLQNTMEVMKQVLQALYYMDMTAGDLRLIHHDLKLENIVVQTLPSGSMYLKIIDMETLTTVSKWKESTHWVRLDHFATTVYYAAPEYWKTKTIYGRRGQAATEYVELSSPYSSYDVFQVACLFVELMAEETSIALQAKWDGVQKVRDPLNDYEHWFFSNDVKALESASTNLKWTTKGDEDEYQEVPEEMKVELKQQSKKDYIQPLGKILRMIKISLCSRSSPFPLEAWMNGIVPEKGAVKCDNPKSDKLVILDHLLKKGCAGFWTKLIDAHDNDPTKRADPKSFLESLTPSCSEHFRSDVLDPNWEKPKQQCSYGQNTGHWCSKDGNQSLVNQYVWSNLEKFGEMLGQEACPTNAICKSDASMHGGGVCMCQEQLCAFEGQCYDVGVKKTPLFIRVRAHCAPLKVISGVAAVAMTKPEECLQQAFQSEHGIYTYDGGHCYSANYVQALENNAGLKDEWTKDPTANCETGVDMYQYAGSIDDLSGISRKRETRPPRFPTPEQPLQKQLEDD